MSTVPPSFQPVAPALKPIVQRAVCDGRRLGLICPFDPAITALMRELGGSWSPPRRAWVFVATEMSQVLQALSAERFGLSGYAADEARALATAAWRTPAASFFTEMLDVQVLPLASGGHVVTSAPDPLVIRAIKSLGGRFHKPARAWEVRHPRQVILDALADVAGIEEAFVFVHEGQVMLEDIAGGSESLVPISVPGAAPPKGGGSDQDSEGVGFLSSIGTALARLPVDENRLQAASIECGLRDYQVTGVRFLLSRSSALLADDMGLGKSRQAVVAGRLAAGDAAVLVVCPSSLGLNWEREIRNVYPDAVIAIIGQHTMDQVRKASWIIANYERLGGLVRETEIRIGVMLVDEAHYLKEHQSGRTRNAFLLAERVPRRFLLTGTPVLNREIEVHTLLRLSGHPLGTMELAKFRKAFAGEVAKRELLATEVKEWMLRRGKDVLKDLGDKLHQVRLIQAADNLAVYKSIMADPLLQAMPKITKLRQHLEALKLDFLIETVQCLPADAKVLIFCEYMTTVEHLLQALATAGIGCVSLVGSDAPKKRMAAVDAFQADPQVRAFIGTTMAAGVGITLTAANYVLFASNPWTPALKRQAEDRAYRSGQTRDVFVITPLVQGTIDEQIHKLLESKRDIEVSIVEANREAVA